MKIIKQGKTEEELKTILNKTKRFECSTCGCVFEADECEYEYSLSNQYEDIYYFCKCPNCKKNAHEVNMREIDKRPNCNAVMTETMEGEKKTVIKTNLRESLRMASELYTPKHCCINRLGEKTNEP